MLPKTIDAGFFWIVEALSGIGSTSCKLLFRRGTNVFLSSPSEISVRHTQSSLPFRITMQTLFLSCFYVGYIANATKTT